MKKLTLVLVGVYAAYLLWQVAPAQSSGGSGTNNDTRVVGSGTVSLSGTAGVIAYNGTQVGGSGTDPRITGSGTVGLSGSTGITQTTGTISVSDSNGNTLQFPTLIVGGTSQIVSQVVPWRYFIATGDSRNTLFAPSWVQDMYLPETAVINQGVSGQTLATTLANYTANVHPYDFTVTGTPCAVSLNAFFNDIASGSSETEVEGQIVQYSGSVKAGGNFFVLFTGLSGTSLTGPQVTALNDVNVWIRTNSGSLNASGTNGMVVDAATMFPTPSGTAFQDGIHLTPAANAALWRAMQAGGAYSLGIYGTISTSINPLFMGSGSYSGSGTFPFLQIGQGANTGTLDMGLHGIWVGSGSNASFGGNTMSVTLSGTGKYTISNTGVTISGTGASPWSLNATGTTAIAGSGTLTIGPSGTASVQIGGTLGGAGDVTSEILNTGTLTVTSGTLTLNGSPIAGGGFSGTLPSTTPIGVSGTNGVTLSQSGSNLTVQLGGTNSNGVLTINGQLISQGGLGSSPGFVFGSAAGVHAFGSNFGFALDNGFNIVIACGGHPFYLNNGTGDMMSVDFNGNPTFSGTKIVINGITATGPSFSGALSTLPTVATGTLVSGTATISNALITAHNTWVVDRASSITNVGGLTVTNSGTVATVRSSNVLDTSVFDLFIQPGL